MQLRIPRMSNQKLGMVGDGIRTTDFKFNPHRVSSIVMAKKHINPR
ncbi:hypothetical protein [Candidatus Chloroploca sp. Khr17]|nr:hypothetical protein [Candidatus Chloroploca sp. Khr17]